MGDYQIIEHTADVGLLVRGRDLEDLLETAAGGMVSIVLNIESVRNEAQKRIRVEAENEEELILRWLREILYSMESDGMVYSRFFIEALVSCRGDAGGFRIVGRLEGEKLNPERHGICTEIKAVTRHGLHVSRQDHGMELTLLFDV